MPDAIDRFLEAYPPDVQAVARQVRALIASAAPDADENLKPGWKVVWYGFGPRMPEQFAVMMPTRNHVGLGFAHGVDLPDPRRLLEGSGKRMRHVKLRTAAEAADRAVGELLRAEVALARAGVEAGPPPAPPPRRAKAGKRAPRARGAGPASERRRRR